MTPTPDIIAACNRIILLHLQQIEGWAMSTLLCHTRIRPPFTSRKLRRHGVTMMVEILTVFRRRYRLCRHGIPIGQAFDEAPARAENTLDIPPPREAPR